MGSTPQAPSSSNNGGGNGTSTAWLPEDIAKAYPTVATRFKDIGSLAKSYIEMERYQGDSVRIPGEKATEEDWANFYNKVGRPEAPDKYEIKFPDGMEVDQNLLSSFRGQAHKLGLSQSQAAGVASWFAEQSSGLVQNQAAEFQADQERWTDELKHEWGYATDKNIAIAAHYLETAVKGDANHPLVKMLDETGLGNHPAMIKFFYEQGMAHGEDQFVDSDRGPSETDAQSAFEELQRITNNGIYDKKHPYWAGDKATNERAVQLREIIDQFNQRQK